LADITLSFVPFAIGQTVEVYPRRSEQRLPDMPPTMVPKLGQGVVAQDKSLELQGLPEGELWAIAPVGPTFRYVAFVA
jgi:hypothetical protein